MAEPKKRSITGKLVENKLTARTDDFTFNVTYVQSRSIGDLCKLAAARLGTKYSASEIEGIYSEIKGVAEEELYSGSTVEFGFTTNSLGVEGSFIGPKAQFDPAQQGRAPFHAHGGDSFEADGHQRDRQPRGGGAAYDHQRDGRSVRCREYETDPGRRIDRQRATYQDRRRDGRCRGLLLREGRLPNVGSRADDLRVAQRSVGLLAYHPRLGGWHVLFGGGYSLEWQQ